jgi:TrmH family RNA methyltransferase
MIASRYNDQFKDLKSLLEPRGSKKLGEVLVSGRKIVPELLSLARAVLTEEDLWPDDLPQQKPVISFERALFKELDIFGTHYPILVCPLPDIELWNSEEPQGVELVLSLQDPANLGAVLRSAEAFGVTKVILLKECAFPFHPKAIRSSSGSSFRIKYASGPSQKEFADSQTFALDLSGTSISLFEWPENTRLLIGEEGQGLPLSFNGTKLSIPMTKSLDSLNASIAASIALFSYREQHCLK